MTAVDPAPRSTSDKAALEAWQHDPDFLRKAGATVLLDTDFVIRAATPAYTQVTRRDLDELLSVNVFDAFPDNPTAPAEQSTRRLAESVEQALRTQQVQVISTMRYDIPNPRRPGRFLRRQWMIVSGPVYDDERVIGARVRGVERTLVQDHLVRVLADYCESLADSDLRTAAARRRLEALHAYLAVAEEHGRLGAEVSGLRTAMRTRPVIDQAKGIIMADRRCSAEEAFQVIKKLSMDSNVRIAEVAAAIVYQAQQ